MANSADPDQLASKKPTDLDLHCLQRLYPGSVVLNYVERDVKHQSIIIIIIIIIFN